MLHKGEIHFFQNNDTLFDLMRWAVYVFFKVYKLPTKRITADCLSSTVQSVSDQGIYIEDEQRQISVDTKISEEITPADAFEDNELQETVEKRLETDDVSNNQSMESVGVWYVLLTLTLKLYTNFSSYICWNK